MAAIPAWFHEESSSDAPKCFVKLQRNQNVWNSMMKKLSQVPKEHERLAPWKLNYVMMEAL